MAGLWIVTHQCIAPSYAQLALASRLCTVDCDHTTNAPQMPSSLASAFMILWRKLFLKYDLIESNGLWIVTTPIMHLKCPASSS